jgi:hypothetical protein
MNFLIDESADIRLAPFLRDLGHDVKTVTDRLDRFLVVDRRSVRVM